MESASSNGSAMVTKGSAGATGAVASIPSSKIVASSGASPIKRSLLSKHIQEFQRQLGKDWEKYHETLSLFLIGKLSRSELVDIITPMLPRGLFRFHNKLLMLNLANSCREPLSGYSNEFASFWNKRAPKLVKVRLSQYDRYKQNIMALPLKERRRIRNITREAGKRGKVTTNVALTRHALLPKIPLIQDKEQQLSQVNNLVQWQQDVVTGINTPLSTESYELPDRNNLQLRVTMIMREHGLTGNVSGSALEVLMLGLEAFLRNVLDNAIDVAKYRENKYTNTDYLPSTFELAIGSVSRQYGEIKDLGDKDANLCIEDMYDTLEMFPYLVEPGGAHQRLYSVMLNNDDQVSSPLHSHHHQKQSNQVSINANTLPDFRSNGNGNETTDTSNSPNTLGTAAFLSGQPQRPESYFGTPDELKSMISELISTM